MYSAGQGAHTELVFVILGVNSRTPHYNFKNYHQFYPQSISTDMRRFLDTAKEAAKGVFKRFVRGGLSTSPLSLLLPPTALGPFPPHFNEN